MTQVKGLNKDMNKDNKDMTNQQLNRELAELMGWKVRPEEYGETTLYRSVSNDGRVGAFSVLSADEAWSYIPDYCTDPAASLEVQAAAIAKDALKYVQALAEVMVIDIRNRTLYSISRLLTATPRERAEAAYLTLGGE